MASSSKYWKLKQEVIKLKKQTKKEEEKLELMRERDILKNKLERQKKERFFRSKGGRFIVGTRKFIKSTEPQRKNINKELKKRYKKWSSV